MGDRAKRSQVGIELAVEGEAATIAAPALPPGFFERGETVTLAGAKAHLTAAWDVRGIDVATVQVENGTVVNRQAQDNPISTRVGSLPTLLAPGPAGAKPQFEIGDVLGEGGMGVVRTAQQLALRREVAVKTLKPEAGQGEAPQLLREARVTGVLEHPNVVPIYALGRDNDDRPLIVMKRITGESWVDEIVSAKPETRLTDAYLRKHLAILKQVAIAVHYGHTKGILHRDLKPENVMIGDFGEVYVVDWGIAVSLNDNTPGVPWVRKITAIEGTPGYMAPEMAAADGGEMGPPSDVYLLGATLHEILTGEPPHSGKTIMMVLTAAFASEPHVYADGVPRDLQRICHKAMSRFPEDRYATALEFADALDEFITHRASTLLSDEALLRLEQTRTLLHDGGEHDEQESEQLYAKFGECRFAFTQALRSWPDNAGAADGLQATLELMIRYELRRDAPRAALALLAELPRPNDKLRKQVDRELEKKRAVRERLAELERDKDISIGAGMRRVIGMMLSSLWGLTCLMCGVLTRTDVVDVTHNGFAVMSGAFALMTIVGATARRETVLTTEFNRRLAVFTTLVFTGYAAVWLFAGVAGIDKVKSTVLHAIVGIVLWSAVGLTLNRRWLPIAYGMVGTIVLVWLFPVYHWEAMGLSGGLSSMYVTWTTFEPPKDEPTNA